MTTYVIKKASELDELTVADLIPFVGPDGRLDVRVEGGAAARPFAVLNVLRSGGFLRSHTWVERGPDDGAPVTLRVTAVLPPAPEKNPVAAEAIEAATRRTTVPAIGQALLRPWRALQAVEPVRTERAWPLTRSN